MKKFFGLLIVTAALFGAGCGNKKKCKAAVQQEEIVMQEIIQAEQASDEAKKEDYSIVS